VGRVISYFSILTYIIGCSSFFGISTWSHQIRFFIALNFSLYLYSIFQSILFISFSTICKYITSKCFKYSFVRFTRLYAYHQKLLVLYWIIYLSIQTISFCYFFRNLLYVILVYFLHQIFLDFLLLLLRYINLIMKVVL